MDLEQPPRPRLSLPLADVCTWHLAAQLVRRHPDLLWVTTPVPSSGLYDLLDVRRLSTPSQHPAVSFNRSGSALAVSWFGDEDRDCPILRWPEALDAPDPREWVINVERAAGLPTLNGGLQSSTPSSLVIRWISQLLWIRMGARDRWTAWTEDRVEIPTDDNPFEAFPSAAAWVRSHPNPAAQLLVHFVGPANRAQPRFALSADGGLWAVGGRHDRLPGLHTTGGSITDLVSRTAGDTLP